MIDKTLAIAGLLFAASGTVWAQTPTTAAPAYNFEQAVYVTCKEANAMGHEGRKAISSFLAAHSAAYHGVSIPNDERGAQVAFLVRGGCTLSPDAYLFAVIDRAIQTEMSRLPKRQ
jgi:hypothetical protein